MFSEILQKFRQKHKKIHFVYENHIGINHKHKRIRRFKVTSADAYDSQKFIDLILEDISRLYKKTNNRTGVKLGI